MVNNNGLKNESLDRPTIPSLAERRCQENFQTTMLDQ